MSSAIRWTAGLLLAFTLTAASAVAQRAPIAQQLTFTPYHASGIYEVGETVGWTVAPGPVEPSYAYKWTIRRNNAVVLKEGRLKLANGKDTIEIAADEPGMIYVAIEADAELTPAGSADAGAGPKFAGSSQERRAQTIFFPGVTSMNCTEPGHSFESLIPFAHQFEITVLPFASRFSP